VYISTFSGVLARFAYANAPEKGPQEERTRVKRWLLLLFVALLIGSIGLLVHQNYLKALGLIIALLTIAIFIWSAVRLSLEVRPPTTRRRFRRVYVHVPHFKRRSHTEELHAAIFQKIPLE
jgi:hypothetical protein